MCIVNCMDILCLDILCMCTQEDNYDKKAKQEVMKQEVIVLDAEEDTTAADPRQHL